MFIRRGLPLLLPVSGRVICGRGCDVCRNRALPEHSKWRDEKMKVTVVLRKHRRVDLPESRRM